MRVGHMQGNRRAPLGELISYERQRRGLTRAELAGLVRRADRALGTDETQVKRWERGQEPQPTALRALARALEQPVERLVSLAQAGDGGKLGREEDEEAERRTFARLAALALAGTLLPGGVGLERLAALGSERRVDDPTLDDLEAVTAAYGRQWKVLPSSTLLPAVHAHLATLGRLASSGARLRAMAADVAVLAGYLAYQADHEDRSRATAYWDLARQLARDVGGETEARALVASSVPHFAIADSTEPPSARTALALLDAAQASAGPTASRLTRAWVLAKRAEVHAALGDGEAAERDLVAAAGCLLSSQPYSDPVIVGPREESHLDGFRGSVAVLLGRYGEAAGILRESLAAMPPELVSWRSVVHTDLGAALAGIGEPEAAADALSSALDLAAEAGGEGEARRVRTIRQRHLARYADAPAVRRLDERLIASL